MDDQDRPCVRRDPRLDLRRAEVAGPRLAVRQDRPGAGVDDGVDRRAEGERGGDHLVPGADAERQHAQVQSRRARSHRHCIGRLTVGREGGLEFLNLGSGPDPTPLEAVDHAADLGLSDHRLPEHQEALPGPNRGPTLPGRQRTCAHGSIRVFRGDLRTP